MNLSKLRLITFDVTDTLLKFRSAPGKQYGDIGALYGVLTNDNVLALNFKIHWRRLSKEHPNFGRSTGLGWENWWRDLIAGTFKDSHNYTIDKGKLDSVADHLIEVYKTSACWQQCYGALGLLSYIRSKKIPMGVVSNFDPRLETILKNNKLKHYFRFILTSYEAGFEKPDKKIFDKVMEMSKIERLNPEECLHIGDNATLDYFGAKNSNWHSYLINDRSPSKLVEKYSGLDKRNVYCSLYDLHKHLVDNNEEELLSHINK